MRGRVRSSFEKAGMPADRAKRLVEALRSAAPNRFEVATATPDAELTSGVQDAWVVDAQGAGRSFLERLGGLAPALVILSDGEVDPETAVADGAALVLPCAAPPDVLAYAV